MGPGHVGEMPGVSGSISWTASRTGDTGYTGLLGAERVPKYDPRPETFGTVDEATSALGLARAAAANQQVKDMLYQIQQEIYLLMGELATPLSSMRKWACG